MTDWGAHMIDIVAWALGDMQPKSAMSVGGKFGYPDDAQETPDTQQAIVEYEGCFGRLGARSRSGPRAVRPGTRCGFSR